MLLLRSAASSSSVCYSFLDSSTRLDSSASAGLVCRSIASSYSYAILASRSGHVIAHSAQLVLRL